MLLINWHHATLKREQLVSHMRIIMVDTITSLQGSDRELFHLKKCIMGLYISISF